MEGKKQLDPEHRLWDLNQKLDIGLTVKRKKISS